MPSQRLALPLVTAAMLIMPASLVAPAPAFGAARPGLFRIDLQPSNAAPSASGVVKLAPAKSPFGLPLTADGRFIFDLQITADGLPAPSSLGAFDQYVAWVVTDDLSQVERIGTVTAGQTLRGQAAYNKFLIFITAESKAPAPRWKGPVVLRGFAPSALLENFSGKTMFNGGMPQ